jgi:uncharacterized membrane protein YfcA
MHDFLLIAVAGLLGGAMNAIAGGGSFITLPALVAAGVPSLNANATSTVALVPSALATAHAYRHESRGLEGARLPVMAAISVVGGALGALLLLKTPQSIFDRIFPFLLLFGVLVFAFGRSLGEALRRRVRIHPHVMPVAQLFLGVYGGYFGGAVGVMMLATWSVLTAATINAMQATRHLMNAAMNATASILFVVGGLVHWRPMAVLLVSATVGGYVTGRLGRHLDPGRARIVISCLNALVVAAVFWRHFA